MIKARYMEDWIIVKCQQHDCDFYGEGTWDDFTVSKNKTKRTPTVVAELHVAETGHTVLVRVIEETEHYYFEDIT